MDLKSKLSTLPEEPGVYLFKDKEGKVIYVGKATSLAKRVKSYFQKKPTLLKDFILISKIADFDYVVSNSEVEALILENNLIKTYKPRYNVNFRDDKSYPLVKITILEDFPKIYTTRKFLDDGAKYFGPYAHPSDLRKTLRLIKEIFLIRSCKTKLKVGKKLKRPCLNFYIKKCVGPCTGNISKEEYQKIVQQVCLFLSGKVAELINELKLKMKNEAQALNFETAAVIRDQIQALQNVMTKQQAVSLSMTDQDVIGVAELNGRKQTCVVVLLIREGRLIGEEHYFLKIGLQESLKDVVTAFIKQYYDRKISIPKELILPCIIDENEEVLIKKWLEEKTGIKIRIQVPKRGKKKHLIDLATKNATLNLSTYKIEEEGKILNSMQNYLKLPKFPQHIEAFDISSIAGKEAVGSLVVFESAKPKKSEYRRFKIKTQNLHDDVGMLEEVIKRRYTRVLNENKPLPDLILVDGGKQQLNTTVNVLLSLGLSDIPVISIAKPQSSNEKERIFTLSGSYTPPSDLEVLHFIQQIRDEAHRFAVAYHRKIRKKKILKT